jgi:glutathione S-transferase
MKLYCDPVSTTSRPVLLFLADHKLPVEIVEVCLFAGEHRMPAYEAINPNRLVPFLQDGDLGLPENSAILKYLAEVAGSPTYPAERTARARVNAAMDWFNTGYSIYMNYLHVYPQMLPNHAWSDPAVAAEVGARGLAGARERLDVLDRHMLRDAYVCGPELSLADYIGSVYVGLSEAIDFDLSPWPNVSRWMERMRSRPAWHEIHAAFYGLIAKLHDSRLAPRLEPAPS